MDLKGVGSSLDSLISSFNVRLLELQELSIARNMYPATAIPDLSAIDSTLTAMESQMQVIKGRLQEEREAVPKAKKLIELSQRQQKKLQHMITHMPSRLYENTSLSYETPTASLAHLPPTSFVQESSEYDTFPSKLNEEPAASAKERKGRSPAPRWYITAEELDSLSSYMRGRLTLDKVNIAINDIAGYADATAQLVLNPQKKLSEEVWEKALEVRNIAMSETVKGKHFFLESDIKGPGLKLDNTGKAILTVLRHLGRIQEFRIGPHRVLTLLKSQ